MSLGDVLLRVFEFRWKGNGGNCFLILKWKIYKMDI